MMQRKSTTSTAVKAKYNAKTYEQVKVQVKKDSDLMRAIEKFKTENPNELSNLIRGLLEKHFELR